MTETKMHRTVGRPMDSEMAGQLRDQIGRGNMMAISGGRLWLTNGSAVLPVSNGYSVVVHLDTNDTYVVQRLFKRGMKVWIKGERTNVYAEQVGDVAYYASCFRSYDETEWTGKA
jgi:hypothetical protein